MHAYCHSTFDFTQPSVEFQQYRLFQFYQGLWVAKKPRPTLGRGKSS